MDLATQSHLAAGLFALVLGAAALARDPSRRRSRLFAALALALATWNLAAALRHAHAPGREALRLLAYAGGAAAGPLALHLCLVIARRLPALRRMLLLAWVLAGAGLLAAWLLRGQHGALRLVALGVPLAWSFAAAARVLHAHGRSEEGSADRPALRVLLILGALAAILGLSDLLPRGASQVPPLGPLALVPFLFALATVGLQRRYLELDSMLARLAAIGLAAAAAAGFLRACVELLGASPLSYFLASLVVVAAAGPLVSALMAGTRAILRSRSGAMAPLLGRASEELARAADAEAAWASLQALAAGLPGGARIAVRLAGEARASAASLCELLEQERAPLTRRFLLIESREAPSPHRRSLAGAALAEMQRANTELVAPVLRDGRLAACVTLGGGRPEAYMHGEAGTALVALGHQALATLARIEAQERARRQDALALAGEMAASLAHDVRNPLGAIRGAAQVLAEARDPAQESEMLEIIDTESARLGRVLGDFLEWSRPRAARRTPFDAATLARRIASQVQLATGGASIEVHAGEGRGALDADAPDPALPDPAPAWALGDEDLAARALANLLRNAREAAGPAGRVSVAVLRPDAAHVAWRVEDDGPGLAPGIRERLFDPFVTTRPDGTGLGLPLVQRAAGEMGGRVEVEDRVPRGMAFTLILPSAPRPRHDGSGDPR